MKGMVIKKLPTNDFLLLITLCILVNLLESWYFGFNIQAESTAEYICDFLISIPIAIFSFWFMFSSDNIVEFYKGMISMMIICASYYVMYVVILV